MQTQISCPNCGTPFVADIYQIIDAARQPQLKEQLLSGQLNLAICPNCGVGGRIATPLLYHDPAHDIFMIHVPQEMNLDQVRREELIGRLVQQVVNQTPLEKRRGYMLQPQTMLTMQSFMERVWETEGVTPEMLARQQRQVDLLRRLATASPDVQDFLIQENSRDIDETFFGILRAQIDATSQMSDSNLVIGLLNLQAKLMTQTEIGRRLEKQQLALHALNLEARKAGGLSPALLAKHVIANEEDETLVSAIALTGQAALNYEFFATLTGEVEKREKSGDKAGAQRLGKIRDQLLEMQREMQEATQQVLKEAQATLNEILSTENLDEAIAANMDRIDDAFMHVLEARMIHAEQSGHQDEMDKLQRIQQAIMAQLQGETPPEVRLITQLVSAPGKEEREKLMAASPDLISGELVQIVEMLRDQSANSGQKELSDRLGEIWAEINARVLAASG
jgi:hypothetical protein